LTDIPYCQAHLQEAEDINYRASAQLAAFCTQRAIRLVYLSTDMIFDGANGAYSENTPPLPINQYGRTKFAAEEAVKSISENYVIARLNLIYGHGEAKKKTFSDRILIANWSGKQYGIYKGQIRSPLALDVAARAIREMADGEFSGIYHLGGPESIDRWEFANKVIAFLRLDPNAIIEVEISPDLKEHFPLNTSFDIKKAQNDLKTELLPIDEGLKLEYGKYLD
jgi:dTDP-4-dehydrorhamnose reductase